MARDDDRSALAEATIADFGEQWLRYRENEGYYASVELLEDIFGPLLAVDELRGLRVAEIGAGTGRVVNMLLDAGAASVLALEPSDAFEVLRQNTAGRGDRVACVRGRGEELPREPKVDLVVSIGVLHHVPDPGPVLEAAREALEPGGRLLAWLYGREGNETYLRFVLPLRRLTARLPHRPVAALAALMNVALDGYLLLCRSERLGLPLRDYANSYLARLSRPNRRLVIYDQLRPAYARYYRRDEAAALFEAAGFEQVRLHHRHGYSWTVVGTKPSAPGPPPSG